MRRLLILLACLLMPLSARAGDFSLDLLAGQSIQEGTDRHDGAYAFGLDYAAGGGWTVAGRLHYVEAGPSSYGTGFSVGLERHFGHSAFSPYVTAGAGPVILNLPDIEHEVTTGEGCEAKTRTVHTSGDDSYMAYSFGGGFDWKYLTAELAYVRPMEDGFDDAIRALVGVRLPVGK
jgi:hypothetical protein